MYLLIFTISTLAPPPEVAVLARVELPEPCVNIVFGILAYLYVKVTSYLMYTFKLHVFLYIVTFRIYTLAYPQGCGLGQGRLPEPGEDVRRGLQGRRQRKLGL